MLYCFLPTLHPPYLQCHVSAPSFASGALQPLHNIPKHAIRSTGTCSWTEVTPVTLLLVWQLTAALFMAEKDKLPFSGKKQRLKTDSAVLYSKPYFLASLSIQHKGEITTYGQSHLNCPTHIYTSLFKCINYKVNINVFFSGNQLQYPHLQWIFTWQNPTHGF